MRDVLSGVGCAVCAETRRQVDAAQDRLLARELEVVALRERVEVLGAALRRCQRKGGGS